MFDNIKSNAQGYWTPKTFGVEGLLVNGFDVDSILVAGSNVLEQDNIPKNTFQLLKFHIKRSLLSALFLFMSYEQAGPRNQKVANVANVNTNDKICTVSEISDPSDLISVIATPDVQTRDLPDASRLTMLLLFIYTAIKTILVKFQDLLVVMKLTDSKSLFFRHGSKSKKGSFLSGPSVAKNVSVVLTSHDFVVPPPPLLPDRLVQENDQVKLEIRAIKNEIAKYNKAKAVHLLSDYKRLVTDAAELVYCSTVASLERLSIYEASGALNQNPEMLARMVKEKFESVSIGSTMSIPDVVFVYPTERKRIELVNGKISTQNWTQSGFNLNGSPKWNKALEVIVLEKQNGQTYATTVFGNFFSMVQQGMLKPEEVETTLDEIFEESFGQPAHLIITSGISCSLKGIPPWIVRGSFI